MLSCPITSEVQACNSISDLTDDSEGMQIALTNVIIDITARSSISENPVDEL